VPKLAQKIYGQSKGGGAVALSAPINTPLLMRLRITCNRRWAVTDQEIQNSGRSILPNPFCFPRSSRYSNLLPLPLCNK